MGECEVDDCKGGAPCLDGNVTLKSKFQEPDSDYRCTAVCPKGFRCSRVRNHKGTHESHMGETTTVARWYDEFGGE